MGLQQLLDRDDIPPDVREIIARALAEQRNVHQQIAVQRDLAIGLLEAASLDEALSLGIETALSPLGLDAAAIFLTDEASECMILASARGVSESFLKQTSRLKLAPGRTELTASGVPVYIARHDIARLMGQKPVGEGLTAVAIIPLLHRGRAFGTLCVASRSLDEIPVASRQPLETIGATIANAVARLQAEQAVRESEERYRALVESSPDLIFSIDRDGALLSVNRAIVERARRPAKEMVGQTLHDLVPGEIADRWVATLREVIDTGEPRTTQGLASTSPEGWFRVTYAPVRGADGRIRMAVGVAYDTTEQKRAQEALRESERRYALATSAGKVGVWEWDTETGELTGDHVLRDMLGYKDYEAPSHVDSLRRLIHPDDVATAMEAMEAHRQGRTGRYEATYRGVHKDGRTRWFVARGSPLPEEASKPRRIVGTTVDVTELKEAEEERRRLEERIRRSEQLERLGVFVGGLAHDFRNIISGIVNNASHALDALPEDGEARTALEHIEAAAKRAAELSGEMLAYAGRGKSDTQPLDLSGLVDQAITIVQSSIPDNVTLCRELAADLPAVEGDATQLRHVAMNLVTNAAEAIPHDQEGTVTVTTGVREVGAVSLSHTYVDDALPGGRYVCLEAADTGCGMDEAAQARAFDPFFSTKPEGRGLGLAAVLGIVRGHRGAIDVASEPGRGTTVTVLLSGSRAAPLPVEPLTAGKASAVDDWQGSGTVLFAEDEAMSRWAGKLSLEKAGFTVLLARDGREAVDLFREHADSIVAVLLDVRMPELNGHEAFEELRRTHPGTRVIVVSGTGEEEDIRRSFGDGLAGFVPKPHSPEELIAAVRRSLGQQPA